MSIEEWEEYVKEELAPDPEEIVLDMIDAAFPVVRSPSDFKSTCPDPNCTTSRHTCTLYFLIIHLNDDHHWDRNRIADWLDGLDIDLSFPVPSDT